tara:strand:- start:3852 stop:4523 length:672 start_codon:yes stop_codon:yes gene_type:complete
MRYGKPIKNKKHIDPRYFLHETQEMYEAEFKVAGTVEDLANMSSAGRSPYIYQVIGLLSVMDAGWKNLAIGQMLYALKTGDVTSIHSNFQGLLKKVIDKRLDDKNNAKNMYEERTGREYIKAHPEIKLRTPPTKGKTPPEPEKKTGPKPEEGAWQSRLGNLLTRLSNTFGSYSGHRGDGGEEEKKATARLLSVFKEFNVPKDKQALILKAKDFSEVQQIIKSK